MKHPENVSGVEPRLEAEGDTVVRSTMSFILSISIGLRLLEPVLGGGMGNALIAALRLDSPPNYGFTI